MAVHLPNGIEHVRAPAPLVFPTEELVPESKRHLRLRTLLMQLIELELGGRACVGSDQFVYWNAADPKRCLAPDVFVRLGAANENFDSWKTWERGAPELAVEIVSPSDAPALEWSVKLERYRELGVSELVRFDPDAKPALRLRVWDRIEGDLVERVVRPEGRSPAASLGMTWFVAAADDEPVALRLARDAAATDLLPTPAEARQREAEARQSAERRIAELEAELRKR